VSWSAHLTHTASGLALTFAAPISRLDMAPDVAAHLANLLAVEARHRVRGVVAGLGDHQNTSNSQLIASDSAAQVINHPLCCDCGA